MDLKVILQDLETSTLVQIRHQIDNILKYRDKSLLSEVKYLDCSGRLKNCLSACGILYLNQLTTFSEIRFIRDFSGKIGSKSMKELNEIMIDKGFKWIT